MNTADHPDFGGTPLDTTTIPQRRLNIDNKKRSNLFPWNGQFSPQLVENLLETYAQVGDFVLDPFVGSGTVLHEAGRRELPAFGSEINPAAFKIAQVYRFINVKAGQRRQPVEDAEDALYDALPSTPSLFSPTAKTPGTPMRQALADAATQARTSLSKILLEALVVLLNYSDKELTADAILGTWGKLRETVQALPVSDTVIEPANCDARALPLPDHRADIVITSPPYINVFNYHQHYRRSVEALGWNLLEVARSEIGSNRKNRGNRFLTVIQYCIDMTAVLHELRRVCKPQARIIIVVGRESNVRKTRFFNGEIVARLAVRSAGYRLQARQERVFQNRFGEMIFEDILHLTPRPPNGAMKPRLESAIMRYNEWIVELNAVTGTPQKRIRAMVALLNQYRLYIDVELVFDSQQDFLYRQKGQLKLDNSVIEEFLPHLVQLEILPEIRGHEVVVGPTTCFSSVYFSTSLEVPVIGGGLEIRAKDQDFAISKKLYLKASHDPAFIGPTTVTKETHIGFVVAECKTNLDKTMFQEACATAHDVKAAVSGARYYLVCEWLDMTPLSTAPTDGNEILLLRKAKRINSNVRSKYATFFVV